MILFPEAMIPLVSTENLGLWVNLEGEPALATAVALSMYVEKPLLHLDALRAQSTGTRIFCLDQFFVLSRASGMVIRRVCSILLDATHSQPGFQNWLGSPCCVLG